MLSIQGANAQIIKDLLFNSPGLQVGMQQGYTNVHDQGLNYQFRLYNRNTFNSGRFGELSLSSGVISGFGYRSQLTPLQYRIGQPVSLLGKNNPLYIYGGLGVFYDRPLEILAPDDPLTVEMGRGLPVSTFWDFEGGFAPFIPIGLGLDVPLEQGVRLNITAGYNHTLTGLKFNNNTVPKGFWGISMGLNFWKQKPEMPALPVFTSVKRYVPTETGLVQELGIVSVQPADLSQLLLDDLNRESINFDVLSSEIETVDEDWLSKTSLVIAMNPDKQIHIKGHADTTGSDQVNEMISESRARAVWMALAESGIHPDYLAYSWYGDENPASENESEEGHYQNRRVEFEIQSLKEQPYRSAPEGQIDFNYELNEPLSGVENLRFDWLRLTNESATETIGMAAGLLKAQPELHVLILSNSNGEGGPRLTRELEKARAQKIKAMMVEMGVEPRRISTFNPYLQELEEEMEQLLQPGLPQQVLIIPFTPSDYKGY